MVKVDLSGTSAFFDPAELDFAAAAAAHRTLADKTGAGSEFTGWLELPQRIRNGELKAIKGTRSYRHRRLLPRRARRYRASAPRSLGG